MDAIDDRSIEEIRRTSDVARVLVGFLSRRGIEVPKEQYDAVSLDCLSTGFDDCHDAHRFWQAYAALVKLLPDGLDPSEIYYAYLYKSRDLSDVKPHIAKSIRRGIMTTHFLTAFSILLLFFLVYFLLVSTTLNEASREGRILVNEMISIDNNSLGNTRFSELIQDIDNCNANQICRDQYYKILVHDLESVLDIANVVTFNFNDIFAQAAPETTQAELGQSQDDEQDRRQDAVEEGDSGLDHDGVLTASDAADGDVQDAQQSSNTQTVSLNNRDNDGKAPQTRILSGKVTAHEWSARVNQIEFVASVVSESLMPLFAGMLGATLAILREVYLGVHRSALSMSPFRTTYIRVALGAISGVAIGWFAALWAEDSFVAALSLFALAFAAGYAVELLFNLLDRIVLILSGARAGAGAT